MEIKLLVKPQFLGKVKSEDLGAYDKSFFKSTIFIYLFNFNFKNSRTFLRDFIGTVVHEMAHYFIEKEGIKCNSKVEEKIAERFEAT